MQLRIVKTIEIEKALATDNGEISPGVYLMTCEDAIADQKDWDEEDPSKEVDLSEFPFWINTNNGFFYGIETDADLADCLNGE